MEDKPGLIWPQTRKYILSWSAPNQCDLRNTVYLKCWDRVLDHFMKPGCLWLGATPFWFVLSLVCASLYLYFLLPCLSSAPLLLPCFSSFSSPFLVFFSMPLFLFLFPLLCLSSMQARKAFCLLATAPSPCLFLWEQIIGFRACISFFFLIPWQNTWQEATWRKKACFIAQFEVIVRHSGNHSDRTLEQFIPSHLWSGSRDHSSMTVE